MTTALSTSILSNTGGLGLHNYNVPPEFIWPEKDFPSLDSTEELPLPLIDLNAFLSSDPTIAQLVANACEQHGFFLIVNHGVDKDVYKNISPTIVVVIQCLNATVFAHGSTGSGKTYTMVGARNDPGLIILSLHTIFDLIKKEESLATFEVRCSYLEVYNEVIYDLLEKSSGHLELREDPEIGIIVAGLKSIKVRLADRILELLNLGNSRRKTESTTTNATSSRSHAVLEITVKRKQKNQYSGQILRGKLALESTWSSLRHSILHSKVFYRGRINIVAWHVFDEMLAMKMVRLQWLLDLNLEDNVLSNEGRNDTNEGATVISGGYI